MLVLHGTPGSSRVIAARCPRAAPHTVDGGGHMLLGQLDQILGSVPSGQGH